MPNSGRITPEQAIRLISPPEAPVIFDVRTVGDVAAPPRLIPTARLVPHAAIAALAEPPGRAVVGRTSGRKLSEGAGTDRNDHARPVAGIALCGAFYRWARDGREEGHDPPAGRQE